MPEELLFCFFSYVCPIIFFCFPPLFPFFLVFNFPKYENVFSISFISYFEFFLQIFFF